MAGIRARVTLDVDTSGAKRSMDRAAAELNKSINGISKKQISFNVNGKSFTQPLGRITASANEFTKSLEASNARVIAFGASVGIINGISEAFKALVVETVKFEKVLQDINVIVGASAGKLQEFGDGLFDVARNTAQAFTVSAEAALEFSRQGLTMEETLRRTNDALILTRLTGLDAASAVSGLTAAVNAFGDAGLSTTDIIDKLAAVDVKFAVSSEDLIKALERTGAVAIDAGVEIDSLIGLVTALQQTTARGGAVIGNGLKTIFTRIQRPESIRQLEEIGIAVKNLSGSILPADKIMINMAKSFDNLSQSQQSNIVQFSAGIFQANVFRAALRDLGKEQSIQAQATEIAGNAAGDAAQKNEMLNKTMSAMASQTTTSIQELAEILGTIGLAPDIDFFLSSIKDGIDGIKNSLGGGEDEGSTFAKGLVKGIGNVITGPAAIAFGAIFIKLFVNIAKFARTSLKDVLGIANEKDKIRAMEESILKALGENLKLQEGLSNLEDDRKAQEMFILGIIEKQNSAMSEQVSLAARLAKPLVKAGINPDFSKNEASGMVPVAASGMIPESSKKKERQGAAKGGYAAGAIDSMNVKGVGTVVYNKAEKVKQFPGMSQPAIMPPKESRAGKGYRDAFAGQHGFDPYASGGLVPNFARMDGSKLILDKSLTKLSANPYNVKGSDELKKNYAELEASGRPITVEAKMSQLVNNSGGSHTKKLKNVLRFLGEKGGVEGVSREFDLQKLPYRGRKNEKAAEEAVLKSEGKPYFSTGGSSGDPTFPVDLVGLGKSPLEVKSGQWKLPNVLLKSMRLYSDDGLLSFAKQKLGVDEQMIQEARYEKFKKGSNLLIKKKIIPKGSTDEEKHQSLLDHRMSEGLVPNFTKKKAGSNYGGDADLLRDIIQDLDTSGEYKYNSLKDITEAYSSRVSGTKESFTAKLSRFRNGTPGQRQGISDKEAIKLTGFLRTKVKLGQTGKRPKMHNDIDDEIIDDMINGNIDPVGAAKKHGHGSGGGKDHSIIKQFKIQLKKAGKDEAYEHVSNYGKEDDDFKEDRELSKYLGLSFQKGGRNPNIDIPAGAVDNQKLKEIGLGLSGKTTNWEAKRSLQHLRGKGIRQMLFEHRNKQGGLFDIIKSFDSKNPGKKEARAIDITEQFGGALAIPGTRGRNYPTGAAMQLSTFTWKAMDEIFKAKFGRNEELAKQNKSIAADIMAEEYSLASRGFIPNYAVNLSNGYHDKRSIGKAISSVYKSKTGRQMGRKDVDFSIERYISAIKDKQVDDGKNFVSNYPGGNFSVGGQKFNFNEISMALLKHGQFMEGQNKGLVPNFADLSKSKRIKNFQGEYEDLAKMGSPLAKWALKTVKDKEFKMIGHGVESWAIGNEEVVYKLPRPQINSFNGSGDLELERWRKQMKVMAQPSLQYEVGPENKAWNLVPDSNIAKRAERIRSQLDSSGIDSLFLPNTEVLKVAGQDEFITSQERVKGSTFFNLQNEILKNPKNKTDFNLDGYKIVEHLMERIGETGMIRDVHSGNFIAEASKKKQLLSTVNQFAPVESKESKHLSGLGLRGLPDDSIAAIDFSSGLIPNFADLYKPYSSKGGKPIGFENYFYNSNNQEDALSYIKSNEHLGRKRGTSELRKFSFAPRVWEMLTSKSPQNIEPRMNVLPLGIRTPVGKDDPYRDTSLGKQMSEQEDFAAIALKNAYGIKPPFFEKRNSWRNGETYSTLMTNSPQFTEMYKLSRSNGENVVPNFAKTFYDFDETLATYPSSVTSADLFNAESASLAEPTDLAKSLKGRTLDILTARAGESKPFISKKLKSWGINSGRIITTGSIQNGQTSAQKKATILQNMQKKNGGRYNLIDDAPENIAAIKALGNKNLMGQLYKFSGQHAGRGSGNAEGLVPNFANVNLYRGQKNKTLDAADISENLPSFASARTPDDVVGIVQDFVKRHVSGDLSGYRNKQGASGEKKASGANSYSTSPQVADNFANSIDLTSNDMSPGQVFQKTVPSKNIFNKAKLLKILNKGSDPKSGSYPSVEKFKKEIASGAVKNWAQKNGGMYLNISGVNNDDSSGKGYGQSMKQIVPPADVGYNDDGTRQIHQGEREVIQLFNNGLIPNFSRVEQVQKSQKRRVKEQVTEEDKDLAHNIFDYLKTNISNLSSKFRFNRSTVSFGGNPEDYEKVFNHSSSRKNKENLIEIARSEMKMNRILKGFMIPHNEGVATARGKYKNPRDPFLDGAMHGGLVPNFADPLSTAISRERAAGVPQARIRVEKSSQLKSAQNPMGLAVTNTRDEPAGVQQGIRRAKTMGIDPKKHGASKGMVPNFAAPQIPDAILDDAKNQLSKMSKAFTDSFSEFSKIAKQFGKEGKETLSEITNFDISGDFEGIKDLMEEKLKRTEAAIESITSTKGKISKRNESRLDKLKEAKSSGEELLKSTEEKSQKSSAVKNLSSSEPEAQKAQLIKAENEMIKKMRTARGNELKSLKQATKASQDFRISLDESAKAAQESEDDGGGLQRLFYLQSAISLVNGQFETLAEGASGLTKKFAEGMLAISNVTASFIQQKELVSEGMNMAGVKKDESFSLGMMFDKDKRRQRRGAAAASDARSRGNGVGRMGGLMRNLSGVGKMFGRFLPVIGQLYTGFTAVNEAFKLFNIGEMFGLEKGAGIMDLLSTQGERAAKKLEKLGESTEKLQGALEALNSQTENREKITELEILGSRRTQKQEVELQQLNLKGLDIDIKAQEALSALLDENLVGTKVSKRFIDELSKGTNTNEDYERVLQRVITAQKRQEAFLTGSKNFGDLIDKKLDKFSPGGDDVKLLQSAAKVRGSQIGVGLSSVAAGSEDMDVKDRLSILNKNIATLESESSTASFRSMSDVTKLTDRLAKNLQGTEDFDAEMMASQINSFIKNVDESIDNTSGLDSRETKAVNAGMKQMVIQLKKLKKNLEGESDRHKEAQLKKEYVTAYKNIVFNIEEFRKNEAHLTKLSVASLTHQNKLNSSQQSLLLEYGAIGKEAAISSDFARKRNAMEAKFIADKQGVEMKSIESLNKLRDTYFNTDILAQRFKKDGEEAAAAVQELKDNIKEGLNDADFSGIADMGFDIDKGVMEKVSAAFKGVAEKTKDSESSLEVITGILAEYGKSMDGATATAYLLALHQKKLLIMTDEDLNSAKANKLNTKRQLELLDKANDRSKEALTLEEEHKFIKEKTVAGAAKLYKILQERELAEKISLEAVKGEAATLAVINDYRKNEALALATSVSVMELGLERQVEKNRTDAVSAVNSLRMLEAQTGSLENSKNSSIILEAKLKSETENAKLALRESEFRLEYFGDQSKRSELVRLQIDKEMADLKTSNLLAAEKNKQLSSGKKLSELVGEQLNATLHSSRLEALTAAENALLLTGKTKQVKLIQQANELQEASNKLTELQNAVTKAGVSDKTLRMTTTADIGIEKANSILGTRTAGMRASVDPSPENMLAYANSLEQTNKLLGIGSRALDRLRSRMAELNVSAENLGADLVDIGIDNARSGLKQMFKDIGMGAKTAKEAFTDFGLSLADSLLDRMMDHNIDQIIKNLTYAFTGEDGTSNDSEMKLDMSGFGKALAKLDNPITTLASEIGKLSQALKDQIVKEEKVNTPHEDKISKNTANGRDVFAGVRSIAAKQEISRMLDEEESTYIERLNKAKPGPSTTIDRGVRIPEGVSDKVIDAPLDAKEGLRKIIEDNAKGVEILSKYESKSADFEKKQKDIVSSIDYLLDEGIKKTKTKDFGLGNMDELGQNFILGTERKKSTSLTDERDVNMGEIAYHKGSSAGWFNDDGFEKMDINDFLKIEKMDVGDAAEHLGVTKNLAAAYRSVVLEMDSTLNELREMKTSSDSAAQSLLNLESAPKALVSNFTEAAVAVQKFTAAVASSTPAPAPAPPVTTTTTNQFSGGRIRHFAKGGFVDGPAGVDKVPAMLTAGEFVIPKAQAEKLRRSPEKINKLKEGGRVESGFTAIAQGATMVAVSQAVARAMDNKDDAGPPEFDKNKFKNLDLRSDVNIKRGDPRLTGRALARDPVMQEYKDHLLEKSAYEASKINEKFEKKMGYLESIVGVVSSYGMSKMTEIAAPYIKKSVDWVKDKADWVKNKTENVVKGNSLAAKVNYNAKAYRSARDKGWNVDYSDVKESIRSGAPIDVSGESYTAVSKGNGYGNITRNNYQVEWEKQGRDKAKKEGKPFQSGGSVPAMLTAGEGFVPSPIAKRIGYDNLNKMNNTGGLPIIQGKGGIDNVGPVGLTEGDFIIKKSSTDKLLRENPAMMKFALQNPDGFKRGEQGYYEGGVVGSPTIIDQPSLSLSNNKHGGLKSASPSRASGEATIARADPAQAPQGKGEVNNNITVNVTIDQTGAESVSTSGEEANYSQEQELSMKIKTKVLEVIRQEKRIGGELG